MSKLLIILPLVAAVVSCGAPAKGATNNPSIPVEGSNWTLPEINMEFIWIPGLHGWAGKYEVTNGEFRRFKAKHCSGHYKNLSLDSDRQPVVQFQIDDVISFARWITERERRAGRLGNPWRNRLPTDPEWTLLARCGDDRPYPWGTQWPPTCGNYPDAAAAQNFPDWPVIPAFSDGYAVTCPVEQSGRNEWGLYGVGGNAWELTRNDGTSPAFMRGGSCDYGYELGLLRSHRCRYVPSLCNYFVGFRLILLRDATP